MKKLLFLLCLASALPASAEISTNTFRFFPYTTVRLVLHRPPYREAVLQVRIPGPGGETLGGGGGGIAILSGANGHTSCGGSGACTTTAVNSTGANFAVCTLNFNGTLTDSPGNTWHQLTTATDMTFASEAIWYAYNITTNASHTFSTSSGNSSLECALFSGVYSAGDPFTQTGSHESAAMSIQNITCQPPSTIPVSSGQLVIAAMVVSYFNAAATSATIDQSFTVTDFVPNVSGVNYGGALAYLIAGGSLTPQPTWTTMGTTAVVCSTASFSN